jgi:soluble lytic murein transglycosylase-like protein
MTPYRAEIDAAAIAHDLDPDLIAAIVEQESNGWTSAFRYEPDFFTRYLANKPRYRDRNPREVSASYGLLQVMYPTAVDYGFTGEPWELFAPTVGLEVGCRIVAALLLWARSVYTGLSVGEGPAVTRMALAAYNAGKGGVKSDAGVKYASAVLVRYERIKRTGA